MQDPGTLFPPISRNATKIQCSSRRCLAFRQYNANITRNPCKKKKKYRKETKVWWTKREGKERTDVSPREIDKPDNIVLCLVSRVPSPLFLSSRNGYRMNGSFLFAGDGSLLLSGQTILARRPAPMFREANSFLRELRRPGLHTRPVVRVRE